MRASPQQAPAPLSPSEAFEQAMAPFNAARAQADDLTEADTVALGVGARRASQDCAALAPNAEGLAGDAGQLLALGRLCIFGQQYEAARATLVRYLTLPGPPERELALLLLSRALLGLKAPGSAEPQVLTLMQDYPYDAQIHFAADQVIDAMEGVSERFDRLALELCGKQNAATLPLLASGKALSGKDASASGNTLFSDALRCAALAGSTGDVSAGDMPKLRAIAQGAAWQGTADWAPMQESLARAEMVGKAAPLGEVHGRIPSPGASALRRVVLGRGTAVLVAFTLWSPSAASTVRTLALSAPSQPIWAVTSWAANTGGEDSASDRVASGLRGWGQGLPPRVSVLVVPNAVLQAFHADTFPDGIVIRNGKAVVNQPITGDGSMRLLLGALKARPPGR